MSPLTVFVGGPIQYAMAGEGSFSASLKAMIEKTLETLESNGFKTLSAHRYERFGKMDVSKLQKEVCQRDRNWMQVCDVFVAILPSDPEGIPVRTEGTAVELGWASALNKKIFILCDKRAVYSHLVSGLGAVADVTYIETDEFLKNPVMLVSLIQELVSPSLRTKAV